MKIIVATYDKHIAENITGFLNHPDYVLTISNSTEELRSLIQIQIPDCLITDFKNSSGHDFYEALTYFKKLMIPVVFLDSENSEEKYHELKKLPLSCFVHYPVDRLTLRSILDNINRSVFQLYSSNLAFGRFLFVRKNNLFEKIDIASIDYLHSEGNYTNIFSRGEKYTIKYSLTRLLEIPNFQSLLRIHRNYAVQKNEIKLVDFASRKLISRDIEIPFGRTYTKSIRKCMHIPQ